jgi:DNA repair photolyase
MYKKYKTKTILNVKKHNDGGWFWSKYSTSAYKGCEWGCEYCYSRDQKYNPHKSNKDKNVSQFKDPFSEYIKIKENAPQLLDKSLKNKSVDIIYLSGYQPIESKYKITRSLLKVILDNNFPVFINEKSPLLLRDLDILTKIKNTSFLNVGWSIITSKDNKTKNIFEKKAPSVKSRFSAMKKLSKNNIITGTIFMPILPYISDTEENIENIVRMTNESNGKYVLDGGLTLWGDCKNYFYKSLESYNPYLIKKYDELFKNTKYLKDYYPNIHRLILKYCKKYGLTNYIPRPISFYPEELQINKRIAAEFYIIARELLLSGQGGYKEWAYRKAGWILDDLKTNIKSIYEEYGIKGLLEIKGIEQKHAENIVKFLKKSNVTTI